MPNSPSSFIILHQVDSTNNYAMAKVHAGMAKHGDGWFSSRQTGGKGQRGKNWHTGQGENIAISIVITPKLLNISQQFRLSAAVALACMEFFSAFAGDDTKIKWPNDIYWRDRKAGGILIENVIGRVTADKKKEDEASLNFWKYSVIGIGININQTSFEPGLKNPVALKQITGKDFDLVILAKELHQLVLKKVDELLAAPFETILSQYNDSLFKRNEIVRLKKGNITFETMIKGVTEHGQLLTVGATDNYFDFGEVEWIK